MGRRITDMIGKKYGRLTVVEEVAQIGKFRMFRCECECGNEIVLRLQTIRSGNTKSCGCLLTDYEDLTGRVFGHLTVLRPVEREDGKTPIKWVCQCDCGVVKSIHASSLRSGETKACGHLSNNARKVSDYPYDSPEHRRAYYQKVLKPKLEANRKPIKARPKREPKPKLTPREKIINQFKERLIELDRVPAYQEYNGPPSLTALLQHGLTYPQAVVEAGYSYDQSVKSGKLILNQK